ncbi:hypothetical protein IAR55_000278 [Kwoniella newhampshirensis]|uniref:Lysine decarboxylase n=1 Tax=Kwoniella newhampshirensis TaxID=1651941 RepID=A0AAW0Z699_9TREE
MSSVSPFPAEAGLKKPVCVFCGSSPGTSPLFVSASQSVGEALAEANIPLVYGGGRRGIMGVVSQAAVKANGYVHGIVPQALTGRASEHTPTPGESTPAPRSGGALKSQEGKGKDVLQDDDGQGKMTTEVVDSMHERKLKMAQLSTGGFIVLPGGYGTFEEALEMITWNQLGIHRLPILILNIGNFYTHLHQQFLASVEAGFIAPENLSLMQLVSLDGDDRANLDESRAGDWGAAAVKALEKWTFDAGVGYGLNWKKASEIEEDKDGSSSANSTSTPEAIFTTMRFTSPSPSPDRPTIPITREMIPLFDLHIERLREAHAYFANRDLRRWSMWIGDDVVWEEIRRELEEKELVERGDWRVRVVISPRGNVNVQVVPAPADAGPFTFHPSTSTSHLTRPLVLDPQSVDASEESRQELDLRLYKTTNREMYDRAYERGATIFPNHPEILLHTPTHLLETTTSNIAILLPSGEWVTPSLSPDPDERPFLNGVMRRYLLREGIVREGELRMEDFIRAKRHGWRVVGYNGLRGVWEAELI